MSDFLSMASHDAFRYGGGLNKSAALVYWHLTKGNMSAKELIKVTGYGRATIFRVLKRMSRVVDSYSGELFPMIENDSGKWGVIPGIDLDIISQVVGTAGIGKRRREQYKQEQIQQKKFFRKNQVDE